MDPRASIDPVALAGARLLRTFTGTEPTPEILAAVRDRHAAGITIFRTLNVESPVQVRTLVERLQAARPADEPPLLIAIDQEGGQLQAIDEGVTAWPGNLALGATGSADLAQRTGRAMATEMAALGVNVLFAPVCDLLRPESAIGLGTRPFGDDPAQAAPLAAAMVRGIRAAGLAATAKHFPGLGRAAVDSHVATPIIDVDEDVIDVELEPFRAAIGAGVDGVMLGHVAVPALTGSRALTATASTQIAGTLLRRDLGFEGVTCTDALNMGGAGAPDALSRIAVEAVAAGADLLLLLHEPDMEEAAFDAIVAAIRDGRLAEGDLEAAWRRVAALRVRLAETVRPPLDVLRASVHLALARETAERAITAVRDRGGLLPLRTPPGGEVIVIAPDPVDLTPAETSSYVRVGLAEALATRGQTARAVRIPLDPAPDDVARVLRDVGRAMDGGTGPASADRRSPVIVGTIEAAAHPGQIELLEAMTASSIPVIAVALRGPYDPFSYPSVGTAICTYGVQPPLIEALADALVGRIPFVGRLPVRDPADGGPRIATVTGTVATSP